MFQKLSTMEQVFEQFGEKCWERWQFLCICYRCLKRAKWKKLRITLCTHSTHCYRQYTTSDLNDSLRPTPTWSELMGLPCRDAADPMLLWWSTAGGSGSSSSSSSSCRTWMGSISSLCSRSMMHLKKRQLRLKAAFQNMVYQNDKRFVTQIEEWCFTWGTLVSRAAGTPWTLGMPASKRTLHSTGPRKRWSRSSWSRRLPPTSWRPLTWSSSGRAWPGRE